MGLLDDAIREHLDLKRRRGADPTEVERAEREALGPVHRAQAPEDGELDEQAELSDEAELDHDLEGEAGFDHRTELADAAQPPVAFDHDGEADGWSYEEPPPAAEPELPVGPETALHEPVFEDEPLAEPPSAEPLTEPPSAEPPPGPPSAVRPPEPPGAAPPPEPPSATPPPHPAGGETVEYDVESAPGLEHPGDAEGERLGESADAGHPGTPAGPAQPAEPPTPGQPATPADGEDVLEETPEFLQDTPDHDRLWFEQRPPKDFDFDG